MTETAKAKKLALQSALAALRATVAGPSKAGRPAGVGRDKRIEEIVQQLREGKRTRNDGKVKPLAFGATAVMILRLCKWGAGDRVPMEVVDRYPWGAASRDALVAAAEAEGVDPALLFAALRLPVEPALAPVEPAPVEPAPVNPAPAPVVQMKRAGRGR
jgi:hypothetical protein